MIHKLSSQEFARQFAQNPAGYAWFLGAGASASAGIPTGYAMIRDFKKRLFCEKSGTPLGEVDSDDPIWNNRINQYLLSHSALPPPNDPIEYAETFNAVFPSPELRRKYIDNSVKTANPSFGHKVLAALLNTKSCPCVFTTNFDNLVETASTVAGQLLEPSDRSQLTVAAIDNAARAEQCRRESAWPLLAKLHGDFQSVELKNTEEELKTQDEKLRGVFTGVCSQFGLILVGYSGRDSSVMDTLTEVLNQSSSYPGGIYWVTRSQDSLLPAAKQFLNHANTRGYSVNIVESQTFDELMADVAEESNFTEKLYSYIFESRPKPILAKAPLPKEESRNFPILQCSSLPIVSMPKQALRLHLKTRVTFEQIRKSIREAKVRCLVAGSGRELLAFGAESDLLKAFQAYGCTVAGLVDLDVEENSQASGLLYDALVLALSRGRPLIPILRRRGHSLIVRYPPSNLNSELATKWNSQISLLKNAYRGALSGKTPQSNYPFSEGIQLRLDLLNNQWWCTFEPFTSVDTRQNQVSVSGVSEKELERVRTENFDRGDPVIDWRRERWATRYNGQWAQIISAWSNLLAGSEGEIISAFDLRDKKGFNANFQLSRIPAWSRPSDNHEYYKRV